MNAQQPDGDEAVDAASGGAERGGSERRGLPLRAATVATGTMVSRLLGLARDVVLAALFRRSETDAFFVAFAIPNALRQLLAEGAVASAVVPVLTETREQDGEDAARQLYRAVRALWLCLLSVVTILGVAFAPQLCGLFAAGWRDQPELFARTVTLTRWVFGFIALMGSAALGAAALNLHRRFAVAAFSPALVNLGMVACAWLAPTRLANRGHDPTLAIVFGALAGGALQVLVQWPALRRLGYLSLPRLALSHPGVQEILRRLAPLTAGMGLYFLIIAASRSLLSDLGEGAQSYFTWAFRLCALPQGVFFIALSTATLPSLASLVATKDAREVGRTYALSMRLAMFVALPATALLAVLAEPVVVAFYQRGEFGPTAAVETAHALVALALGIVPVAALRQLVPVFYAHGDTRTPVIGTAVHLVVFVTLGWWLRRSLDHVGIAVAFSGANAVQLVVMWALLRRRLESLRLGEIASSAIRTALACAGAAFAGWMVARWTAVPPEGSGWERLIPAVTSGTAFGMTFLALAWLVRSRELRQLARRGRGLVRARREA
ncbi:MAG: murein biosynthesis integral membrane protein MurJ [Deltaproteobacteria bacterium]|nr:murein biosynthesis integral membrane protein MurJ [Deltaproteobacteria bacterium]